MENKLHEWDELYERAIDSGYGDPELVAKDEARCQLTEIIEDIYGYNIDNCECPEDEIDSFLWKANNKYLFDENGNLSKIVQKKEMI